MSAHVQLTERSHTNSLRAPIGKGREGKGIGGERKFSGDQVQIVKAVEGRRANGLGL